MAGSLQEYIKDRCENRVRATITGGNCTQHQVTDHCIHWLTIPSSIGPWLRTEHEDTILGHPVQWTRPGRLWTMEEPQMLSHRLEMGWNAMFAEGSTRIRVVW